ncbi:MAG TPA: hypothetical protein VN285_07330 [Candidatus Deferrimicrobium sp.]|nr:hypothetical protein [Candidatus Deferrimicrobium sp.]
MKKSLWPFLLKLLVFSLVLGYLWFSRYQKQYPYWIDGFADPFFKLIGVRQWWLALVIEHFTNLVPYLALVLASPGLVSKWKRSLIALVGGVAILIVGHLLLSSAVYFVNEKYALSKDAYRILVPMYIINDALPLALWIGFFPKLPGELFGLRWVRGTADLSRN